MTEITQASIQFSGASQKGCMCVYANPTPTVLSSGLTNSHFALQGPAQMASPKFPAANILLTPSVSCPRWSQRTKDTNYVHAPKFTSVVSAVISVMRVGAQDLGHGHL